MDQDGRRHPQESRPSTNFKHGPLGTLAHAIVGAEVIYVSFYRHQVVDRLGDDLMVTARAADGIVEAVEQTSAYNVALQWYPEDRHATGVTDAALFADLVDLVGKWKEYP